MQLLAVEQSKWKLILLLRADSDGARPRPWG